MCVCVCTRGGGREREGGTAERAEEERRTDRRMLLWHAELLTPCRRSARADRGLLFCDFGRASTPPRGRGSPSPCRPGPEAPSSPRCCGSRCSGASPQEVRARFLHLLLRLLFRRSERHLLPLRGARRSGGRASGGGPAGVSSSERSLKSGERSWRRRSSAGAAETPAETTLMMRSGSCQENMLECYRETGKTGFHFTDNHFLWTHFNLTQFCDETMSVTSQTGGFPN